MNWMLLPLKRYADFQGRSGRMEFWMFVLFQIVVLAVIRFILSIIFPVAIPVYDPSDPGAVMAAASAAYSGTGFLLYCLISLAFLIPSIAVAVRRLHDTDKSGWLLLLGLIPLIGAIILIVFYVTPGTPGDNRFGPAPPTTV